MTQTDTPTKDPLIVDQIIKQAISCHKDGNLPEAERFYRIALQVNPQHADVNHNLGMVLAQSHRAAEGLPYFKAALEINPDKDQYWLSYVNGLIDAEQYAMARQVLEDRRENGLSGEAADRLGTWLSAPSQHSVDELATAIDQGEFSRAEMQARVVVDRFPQLSYGWKTLGAVLMKQGRFAEALQPLKNATVLSPSEAENQSNLGNVYMQLGNISEAEACYHHAITCEPGNVIAQFNLGKIFFELGRLDEAEGCFNKVLERDPDFAEVAKRLNLIRQKRERRANNAAAMSERQDSDVTSVARRTHSNLLDYLRENKILGKLVALFGSMMFMYGAYITWGRSDNRKAYAAKIDDTEISMEMFSDAYNTNRERARQKLVGKLTPEQEAGLALRRLTLDALINQKMLRTAAIRQGMTISDSDVIQSIASMPVFQNNGQFDMGLYKQVLARKNMTPDKFENMHRYDLLAEKMRQLVIADVKVTDQELNKLYHREHDLMVLAYVAIAPSDVLQEVKVSTGETEQFFEKNRSLFLTPEKISLSFVRLSVDKGKTSDSISGEEIERYFALNMMRYQMANGAVPALKSVKEKALADLQKEKIKKVLLDKVIGVRNKNVGQTNLRPLADELGVQVRKAGLFSVAAPPAELKGKDAALKSIFALKDGEIGGPFETDHAVYLVQVTGRQPSVPAPFESVRTLIENKLRDQKSVERARSKAEETLQDYARGKTTPLTRSTEAFSYDSTGRIPGIGVSPEMMAEVSDLMPQLGVAKKIYEVSGRWYAVQITQRFAATEDGFGRLKGDLLKRAILEKQQKKLETWYAEQRGMSKIDISKQLAAEIAKETGSMVPAPTH
jgi:peptidyl-prolyl cis-trans isomerase D